MTRKVLARTPDGKNDFIRTDVYWANRNIKAIDENGIVKWEIEDSGDTKPQAIVKVPQRYYSIKLTDGYLLCIGGHADYEIDPCTGKLIKRIEKTRLKPLDDSYRHEIKNPSEDFKRFMYQYFDEPRIYMRLEEDQQLPGKLKGEELTCAIKLLIANIDSERIHIISALKRLESFEAINQIKKQSVEAASPLFKIEASYLLHKWVGEPSLADFYRLCEKEMDSPDEFVKGQILEFAKIFSEEDALKIFWVGLKDMDFGVRTSALRNLRIYFGVQSADIMKNDNNYHTELKKYVSNEVFDNKALFEARLSELKKQIESWKRV